MEPTIELEKFAVLSAELDAGMQRDELCAREGITVDQWVATQEAWLARMADETARKRFVLTNQYNTAFVARRRELTHGAPRMIRRAEPAKVVVAAPLPEPVIVAPPPIVAMPAEPSFVKAQQAPAFFTPPPVEAPAVVEPPPVVAPPAVKERKRGAATVALPTFTEPAGAPLPFKPAPPAPPPPPGAQPVTRRSEPPPRPAAEDLGSTTAAGQSPFAVSRMALPFQPAAAGAAVKKSEPPRPAPAPAPEADHFGAGTVVGAMSPFATGASPLPFQGSAPQPQPQASKPAGGAGLPFHAPSPTKAPAPAGPRLTLEQFASLTAEIAVAPHNAAQIRARYGFDEAGHAAEAEAHNRRFSADKALYTRYLELFQSFRDYVARAQR